MSEKHLFSAYLFFNNAYVVAIRALIFIGCLMVFVFQGIQTHILAVYMLFLVNELFIALKINTHVPQKTISKEIQNSLDATLFPTRRRIKKYTQTQDLLTKLFHLPEAQFMMKKLGAKPPVAELSIPNANLLSKATEVVEKIHGKYISDIDILASYILLSEHQTKYLVSQELREEDVIHVLQWTRSAFHIDGRSHSLKFYGNGIFDFFVYGWNYEIKKYAIDFTLQTIAQRYPPVNTTRKKEFEELTVALSKDLKNNAILVGEPGTGKTTLVEYFAYKSFLGEVPHPVAHKKVFEIFVDRLLAGVNSQGELNGRLGLLISEISHSGNVIVFIQNIENIFGGGGMGFDLSGVLFEYLQNGAIQLVGTSTPVTVKKHIEQNGTLRELFEIIEVREPDREHALLMLFEKTAHLEKKYGVEITYTAVKEAVELADSYMQDQYLPGKAVNVVENVISSNLIRNKRTMTKEDVVGFVETKTHVILEEPTSEEKETLLHLEDKIHEQLVDQEEAVSAIARSLRRLRSGFEDKEKPISVFLFLGPTGVGKTEAAKALAKTYFGQENAMIRLDMSEYQTQDHLERIIGGGQEGITLIDQIRHNPFSLLLLDEFEKAHPKILDLFLQVFDEGRLTDYQGHTVSFVNTIIIATSNAGSEYVRERVGQGEDPSLLRENIVEYLLRNGLFKPELINRFDEVIIFKPLSEKDAKEVARLMLTKALARLEEEEYFITFDNSVLEKIVQEGYSAEFGARNLRRYIQDEIEEYIARIILEGRIEKGEKKVLRVVENAYTIY